MGCENAARLRGSRAPRDMIEWIDIMITIEMMLKRLNFVDANAGKGALVGSVLMDFANIVRVQFR